MTMDVSTFLSSFGDTGPATPTRYRVRFTLPAGVPAFPGSNPDSRQGNIAANERLLNGNRQINIMCHTLTMPQRSLLTYEHKQLNAPYKVPYSASYDPVSFMFYSNSRMDTRRYLDTWQQAAVNISSNSMNFYSEYTADIEIEQLDKHGNPTYGVQLIEAYPMTITAVDYSYSNANTLTQIGAVFTYKYFKTLTDTRMIAATV